MAKFVFDPDQGRMVNKVTGEPMVEPGAPLAAPMVVSDTPGYTSPIDGKWVEGRRARRYDLESNNCVDANDLPSLGGRIKNERFAKKRGLDHLIEK